ncbi:MAG: radical SAM protein [Spirochaetales bacterium]|nr:radical SAM protein [Spirochaetales bacterium]
MACVLRKPGVEKKLDILAASAKHDVCLVSCSMNSAGKPGRMRDPDDPLRRWIFPAHVPGKGEVGILKVLQTNVCRNHCSYCAFSASRDDVQRTGFTPDELAASFMQFVYKKLAHGIFISSGVGMNPDVTMARMIATAEILRKKYRFNQYIHLKILPGVSYEMIEAAARYANRISINLEAPTRNHLKNIAPEKRLNEDLVKRMRWAARILQQDANRGKSQTTQFVVGASDESDLDILKTVDWIYREAYVFRSYFSSYSPIDESSAPNHTPMPLLREHKLYQCDFLLRAYGFRFEDLVFNREGLLPGSVDPKQAYALMHPELYPVDVNRADEPLLLKVPGIGPISAQRITGIRKNCQLTSLKDLKKIGVYANRAAPYITFSGKRDKDSEYVQGILFPEDRPESWQTGLSPFPGDPQSTNDNHHYPALKDKWVNYTRYNNAIPVMCRPE